MKKMLVLVYDGFSEMELSVPISFFAIMGGISHRLVGIDKKSAIGWAGTQITAAATLNNTDIDDYDILFLPGISPFHLEELMRNARVLELLSHMNAQSKIVATICLTPLLLGEAGLLKDRIVSSDAPPGEYEKYGVRFVSDAPAVKDGRLLSGKGLGFIQYTQLLYKSVGLNDLAGTIIDHMTSGGGMSVAKSYEDLDNA